MKLETIEFVPRCALEFDADEVRLLMRLSALHYDAHCREVGKVGGFLYGLNNRYVEVVPEVVALGNTVTLSFREIDTLCKILELGHMTRADEKKPDYEASLRLREQLGDCLRKLNNVAGLQQKP